MPSLLANGPKESKAKPSIPRPKSAEGRRDEAPPLFASWRLPPPPPGTLGPFSQSAAHTPPPPPSSGAAPSYLPGLHGARATLPSHRHSNEARPPPATVVHAGPASRMRKGPIERAVSLSNRFESLRLGRSIGRHRGEANGEVREANRR